LVDDLDFENTQNSSLQFLGPVGDYMAFVKCGVTQCDVYYSEILAGQLYVGFLYTINENSEIADFCP
jgi:hypothetical protein